MLLKQEEEEALSNAAEEADKAKIAAKSDGGYNGAKGLTEGIGDSGKIPWNSWQGYEKETFNGREYAKVGKRLYSKHAVDRMQPSGKRYKIGDAILQVGGVDGRSIAPQFVEDVIRSSKPVYQQKTGNYEYVLGMVKVITNPQGCVVTIMTYLE